MTDEEALKFAKEQTYIFDGTMKEFLQFVIDKLERPSAKCENCDLYFKAMTKEEMKKEGVV
ncbi:MAG: hypothetical protein J6Y02_20985 [Pseudobutyrivibrio sp.]|nr:hypothetical protein [Pseudobutyrivibrio sp.]